MAVGGVGGDISSSSEEVAEEEAREDTRAATGFCAKPLLAKGMFMGRVVVEAALVRKDVERALASLLGAAATLSLSSAHHANVLAVAIAAAFAPMRSLCFLRRDSRPGSTTAEQESVTMDTLTGAAVAEGGKGATSTSP